MDNFLVIFSPSGGRREGRRERGEGGGEGRRERGRGGKKLMLANKNLIRFGSCITALSLLPNRSTN